MPADQHTLTVLVSQLRLKGINAVISAKSDFHTRARNQKFDVAHLLTDVEPQNGDRIVIIDAHKLDDTMLSHLRRASVQIFEPDIDDPNSRSFPASD